MYLSIANHLVANVHLSTCGTACHQYRDNKHKTDIIKISSSLAKGYDSGPLLSTLGRSRIHFEDSRFNISLVTATSTRIQSEDVLHGAHVIDEM